MSAKIIIYHNPRCTKSRETLELLRLHGVEPVIIEYLKEVPSKAVLRRLLKMLGMTPRELLRKKEKEYLALGLDDESLRDEAILDAMVAHPILIERPIVMAKDKAVLGRPPVNVLTLLGS